MDEITELVEIWDGARCGPVQQRLHRLVTDKITDARRRIDELAALTADLQRAATQLAGPPVDGPCGPECACVADTRSSSTAVSVALTPKPDTPIVCTLGADDLAGRVDDWQAMMAQATGRTPTVDGMRMLFARSVDVAGLARLVAAEQECCAFYTFAIVIAPDGDRGRGARPFWRGGDGQRALRFGRAVTSSRVRRQSLGFLGVAAVCGACAWARSWPSSAV